MTTRMGALIVIAPEQARAEILAAIDAAEGNRTHAAAALAVPIRSLHNWIAKLGLWADIDALCEKKGYAVQPGPARKLPTSTRRKNVKAMQKVAKHSARQKLA